MKCILSSWTRWYFVGGEPRKPTKSFITTEFETPASIHRASPFQGTNALSKNTNSKGQTSLATRNASKNVTPGVSHHTALEDDEVREHVRCDDLEYLRDDGITVVAFCVLYVVTVCSNL